MDVSIRAKRFAEKMQEAAGENGFQAQLLIAGDLDSNAKVEIVPGSPNNTPLAITVTRLERIN